MPENDVTADKQNTEFKPQAGDAAQSAETANAIADPSAEIERLSHEAKEATDRALRFQAELDNFRKRMRREMEEERRLAALPLISDLLNVIDNLDRAIEAADKSPSSNGLLDGVKLVQSLFLSILERHHCRRLGQVGETFDPNLHQAIAQEPSQELEPGKITRIARFGYQLHDRVVRPAQVLVSTGPSQNPS